MLAFSLPQTTLFSRRHVLNNFTLIKSQKSLVQPWTSLTCHNLIKRPPHMLIIQYTKLLLHKGKPRKDSSFQNSFRCMHKMKDQEPKLDINYSISQTSQLINLNQRHIKSYNSPSFKNNQKKRMKVKLRLKIELWSVPIPCHVQWVSNQMSSRHNRSQLGMVTGIKMLRE